jgi:hypothetical protein
LDWTVSANDGGRTIAAAPDIMRDIENAGSLTALSGGYEHE